jgi:lipoate-protein ligase B
VGVAIHRGILLHGLSLNVHRHRLSFLGLRPCGLDGVLPGFLPCANEEPSTHRFESIGDSLVHFARQRFTRS